MIRITDVDGKHTDELKEGMTSSLYGECEILKISPKQYLAMVSNNNCMLATILTESGCFLTSAIPFTDEIIVGSAQFKQYLCRQNDRTHET